MKKAIKNKIILIILSVFIVGTSFLTLACSSASFDVSIFQDSLYSHLVLKESNKTFENFRLNYSSVEWQSQGEKQDFEESVKLFFDHYSESFNNYLVQKLAFAPENVKKEQSAMFTKVSVEHQDNIIMEVSFPNKEIWGYLSTRAGLEKGELESGFFTTTRIDRLEKIGSVIRVNHTDMYMADYFESLLIDFLQNNHPKVLQANQIKTAYAYATMYRRQHSNADNIALVQGKYFHQWNLTQQDKDIKFFSTYPRVEVWYVAALSIAFLTLGVVLFMSLFTKNKTDKTKVTKIDTAEKIKTEIND